MSNEITRRKLLSYSVGTVSALASSGLFSRALAAACGITPKQTQGPFYPVSDQLDKNTDLTWVEIWQACESGRYNHPQDPNTAWLDPDFQYWGQAVTDATGAYGFKTIVPGAYPADVDWMRPAHIHYKVSKLGYHELITQLYFEGDPYLAQDKILQAVPASQRSSVVVPLQDSGPELEAGSKTSTFNLTILKA